MLSAASFEGVLVHVDGNVLDVNDRLGEMLGYDRHELVGTDLVVRSIAPEDLPGVLERVASGFEGEYVITGVRRDGSRFRAELQTKQGRLGASPLRVVAVRDVTERERVNALLRESEQRFHDLAEEAFDLIVYSHDGLIVEVGGRVRSLLGIEREDMLGRSVLEFTAPTGAAGRQGRRRQQPPRLLRRRRDGAERRDRPRAHRRRRDDAQRAGGARGGPARPASGAPARGRAAGARAAPRAGAAPGEPRRARRGHRPRLQQPAHGHPRQRRVPARAAVGGEDLEAAAAIVKAAQRAATLTRQMLAYAGQRDLGARGPVDVGELVRELRALLDATLSKKASLELAIEPGSVVLGDRATLSQVLMNLLTNASDALGEQPGRITVQARRVRELDARWDAGQGATVRPGHWVLVEVRDTGVGMDAATRGRVFEPFFSTKEKGHGLGLAACLGIVAAHGGAVLVESELGRGSCFSLLLPASKSADRADGLPDDDAAPRPCRVLVVDDEAVVREQLRRSLELRGYVVDEASDGRAALAALAPTPGARPDAAQAIDVVLLDMTMPDMDGAEVLVRARAAGSRVPIVVSSGYLDVTVERRLPRGQFQGFLSKPYGATDLVNAIERARAAR